jgi:cytochrome c peroxidase
VSLFKGWVVLVACTMSVFAQTHVKRPGATRARQPADELKVPLGLLPLQWPKDNPYSKAKWELGRALYYDVRLSADSSLSCASCHSPKLAFADALPNSPGIRGQHGSRSAPTVINRGYSLAQFWDGRAGTLEEQAKGPMANPIEMGHTHEGICARLTEIRGYHSMFAAAFGSSEITIERASKAIATFERTVLSGNSPFDKYQNGDKKAMTVSQIRGMDVYFNKAKCDQCHEGINFTTNAYHNLGIGTDKPEPDAGRYVVTKDARDWGAFKTPTLREIANTSPYMHDGSLKTLDEVVQLYDKGGIPNKNLDERIKPLKLTDQDRKDLVDFLRALSGEGWQQMGPPDKFPE